MMIEVRRIKRWRKKQRLQCSFRQDKLGSRIKRGLAKHIFVYLLFLVNPAALLGSLCYKIAQQCGLRNVLLSYSCHHLRLVQGHHSRARKRTGKHQPGPVMWFPLAMKGLGYRVRNSCVSRRRIASGTIKMMTVKTRQAGDTHPASSCCSFYAEGGMYSLAHMMGNMTIFHGLRTIIQDFII